MYASYAQGWECLGSNSEKNQSDIRNLDDGIYDGEVVYTAGTSVLSILLL